MDREVHQHDTCVVGVILYSTKHQEYALQVRMCYNATHTKGVSHEQRNTYRKDGQHRKRTHC